jgi:hypothetical protein
MWTHSPNYSTNDKAPNRQNQHERLGKLAQCSDANAGSRALCPNIEPKKIGLNVRTYFGGASCRFPMRKPSRDVLSNYFEQADVTNSELQTGSGLPNLWHKKRLANFHQPLEKRADDKLIWKPSTCSCPNLEPDFRSLGLICPNIRAIYQDSQTERIIRVNDNVRRFLR